MAMQILVQGDWVDEVTSQADSMGLYRIEKLYRGQYLLKAFKDGDLSFSKTIGMIKYSDREYDIIIPPPPDLVFEGTITRCSDNVKLSNVQITLRPLELYNGAVLDPQTDNSNDIGHYQIQNIYPGVYTIRAAKGGHTNFSQTLTIPNTDEWSFEFDFCMNGGI